MYERNSDGAVITPPINRRLEMDAQDALARCDFDGYQAIMVEYNAWRDDTVKRTEDDGLGWSDDDMRGGLSADQRLSEVVAGPDFNAQLAAGAVGGNLADPRIDAMERELAAARAESRKTNEMLATFMAQFGQTDKPTEEPAPKGPLGGVVPSGPTDKPTPAVEPTAAPLGVMPGEGGVPAAPLTSPAPGEPIGPVEPSNGGDGS